MGADAEDIGLTIHPHPTLSETVGFAAEVAEGTITDLYAPKKKAYLAYRRLDEGDQFWRRSNQMSVLNTDLAKQLEAKNLGARLWRLEPGQASTKHRHPAQEELYVLLEGTGG